MLLNAARLQDVMARDGVDAVIATSPENVTYTSDYWSLSQWIRRGPQVYVIIPRAAVADAVLVCATSTLDLVADQEIWVKDVRRYGFFQADMAADGMDALDRRQAALYAL